MIKKVMNTIKTNNMFRENDKVIVAVSGGPDSMCLLNVLYELRNILNINIMVAHLNHCLRGEEADFDEDYVREFCNEKNIKFFQKKVDINKLAKQKGISSEMAGREARYNFFEELMKRYEAQKIAIAHNANDNVETVIMRILRGTGLEGLEGIKPIRDNIFVRPLINIAREEIEKYCKDNNINARIDKTNLENIYSRNKIRLDMIPYIEKNFNSDIISTINRFSELVCKDNDYLEQVSLKKYEQYCEEKEGKILINKNVFNEHEAIVTRVIRKCLLKIKGNLNNLEKKHIYNIIELQKNDTGKKIILPGKIMAYNNYGDIYIYKHNVNLVSCKKDIEIELRLDEVKFIEEMNLKVYTEIVSKSESKDKKKFVKYFDYDKILGNIRIRYRKAGDKITPLGMKGQKKLKDLFMDLKIPKEKRDKIPIICFGEEIAWVVGYRISDKFKLDNNTKKILKIQIERGE